VFIGVDNIFKTGKKLLNKYSRTKAIFLLNPKIFDQMEYFSSFDKKRIVIYALKAKLKEDGLQNSYIQSYLKRRGEIESQFSQIIHKYAIFDQNFGDENFINFANYYWFLFKV
jgi:hypothetical protein